MTCDLGGRARLPDRLCLSFGHGTAVVPGQCHISAHPSPPPIAERGRHWGGRRAKRWSIWTARPCSPDNLAAVQIRIGLRCCGRPAEHQDAGGECPDRADQVDPAGELVFRLCRAVSTMPPDSVIFFRWPDAGLGAGQASGQARLGVSRAWRSAVLGLDRCGRAGFPAGEEQQDRHDGSLDCQALPRPTKGGRWRRAGVRSVSAGREKASAWTRPGWQRRRRPAPAWAGCGAAVWPCPTMHEDINEWLEVGDTGGLFRDPIMPRSMTAYCPVGSLACATAESRIMRLRFPRARAAPVSRGRCSCGRA